MTWDDDVITPLEAALAATPTRSTAHMTAAEREESVRQMLADLSRLAASDGCIAAAWAAEKLAALQVEVTKLQRFKDYCHSRLDAAGVPADPESSHRAEGCRIGGRLDLDSEPGKGTRIRMILPRIAPLEQAAE